MENQIQQTEYRSSICGAEIFQGYPDVLNLEEMSELLQISTKTGRRLLNNGEIRSFRIGRSYRVPKQHLISFIMGTPSEKVVC